MQSSTIFVRNLSYKATEHNLEDLFAPFGQVVRAVIPKEFGTTNSRGFGFVEMESPSIAEKAIEELNETEFMGRTIFLNEANEKKERGQRQANRQR